MAVLKARPRPTQRPAVEWSLEDQVDRDEVVFWLNNIANDYITYDWQKIKNVRKLKTLIKIELESGFHMSLRENQVLVIDPQEGPLLYSESEYMDRFSSHGTM